MLQFYSGSSANVNSRKAIRECLEIALKGEANLDCDLLIIHSSIGHNFEELLGEARKLAPGAQIAGCTGAGVIGNNGPDESMKALAIMAIKGPKEEFSAVGMEIPVDQTSLQMGIMLGEKLGEKVPGMNMILLYPSFTGIGGCWNEVMRGIESVHGKDVAILGGLSEDNGRFISDFQFLDERVIEKGIVAVGIADPTLEVINQSNHGLDVIGTTFEVTRSDGNRILEMDGEPAWARLLKKLGMPMGTSPFDIIAFASLAMEIPEKYHEEYRSKYLIVSGAMPDKDGSLVASVNCPAGTKLWLIRRNEESIFRGAEQLASDLVERTRDREVVAFLHTECATRGKLSFNQIVKDKLIKSLQSPFIEKRKIPWLGFYAAGQIAPICGDNQVHFYTSSLFLLTRKVV